MCFRLMCKCSTSMDGLETCHADMVASSCLLRKEYFAARSVHRARAQAQAHVMWESEGETIRHPCRGEKGLACFVNNEQ